MTTLTVKTVLKQITDADLKQVDCQFKIANLLTAIRDHKLYENAGYNNFSMMVRGELYFSPSTAIRYINLYNQYETLKYNKPEFMRLMSQFGWSRLQKLLAGSDKKLGYRALKTLNDKYDDTARGRQFHFELDDKLAAKFTQMLSHFGMTQTQNGTKSNVTSSLQALVEDYDRLKKKNFRSGKQSVRKAS